MNFRCRIMFSSGRQREPRGLGINMIRSAILIFHVLTQYSASQNEVTVRRGRDDSECPAKKKKRLRQTSLSFSRKGIYF